MCFHSHAAISVKFFCLCLFTILSSNKILYINVQVYVDCSEIWAWGKRSWNSVIKVISECAKNAIINLYGSQKVLK